MASETLTRKQQYDLRKAARQRRQEAEEVLGDHRQGEARMEDILDRFATALERIADVMEARDGE